MKKAKAIEIINAFTFSTGLIGSTACILGTSVAILGFSALIANGLGEIIKPHKSTINSLVIDGVSLALVGTVLAGSSVVAANIITDRLVEKEIDDQIDEIDEESITRDFLKENYKNHCFDCRYYEDNDFLKCAVNPDLPENCSDYKK